MSRQPFPQPGELLSDSAAPIPPRSESDGPKRFIGGIRSGHFPFGSRASWPFAELIVTDDEVILRPRWRFVLLFSSGARYSIGELSFAEVGTWGIRFHSARNPREIWYEQFSPKREQIARLLAERGIEVRDRKGRQYFRESVAR